MSNVELARRVGVSEKTVRLRVARLVEQAGLRFRAELDDDGRATQVVYLVVTGPGKRLEVADRLARLDPVDSVRLTTGAFDIVVEASFDSDAAGLEFYVREVEAGPGVERSTSIHVIKTVRATSAAIAERLVGFHESAEEASTVEALLDLACDAASDELGADRVFAGLTDRSSSPDRDPLFSPSSRWRGLSSRYIDALYRNMRANTLVPTLASRGQHLFIADAQTDPIFAPVANLAEAEGFHSFLTLPIRHEDEHLGSLNLYYDHVIPFSAERVSLGQELADAIGKHLQRVGQTVATPS
jgi:DNA-binding Lrp family transcriptional regulator